MAPKFGKVQKLSSSRIIFFFEKQVGHVKEHLFASETDQNNIP